MVYGSSVRLTFTALRFTYIDKSYELLVNKLRKQSKLRIYITAICYDTIQLLEYKPSILYSF